MKWTTVRERIKRDWTAPTPPTGDRFWSDFRERVRFEQRSVGAGDVEQRRGRGGAWLWVRRTLVPAMAAVAVAVLLHVRRNPTESIPNRPVVMAGVLSTVEDIDVLMDYDSVFIVEDPKARGTLIWVTGASSAGPGG